MPVCDTCGDSVSGREGLQCPECSFIFCRDHYHGHECEPLEEREFDPPEFVERIASGGVKVIARVGYILSTLFAVLGTVFLLDSIDVILVGGEVDDAIQALSGFVITGGLFSVATFLVVVSYILMKHAEDSGGTSDD